ncbi:YrhB domain-containing protein [Longimicrobium terrae]|uniref:Immunity protein 35 domain-containing protein n=1 Tax=Longimicrobium terrae TaxID=1639882 RepID=A0A841H255_9BACT|nr:YrhB domain-containing protein [Longimicrobium terrae]MBB4637562.1 hypothetical protein [Longimicrobium terrae]MBB6071959.1 hypothetical protein [Longimicrobium terrae]NNC30505.1 hypothetical protein [Longimicrobium terrae]
MITEAEAKALVAQYLETLDRPDLNLVILEEQTLDLPYGWVFFYTTELFQQTRNPRFLIGGNAPVLVEKGSGILHVLGTASSVSAYLAPHERRWREGVSGDASEARSSHPRG